MTRILLISCIFSAMACAPGGAGTVDLEGLNAYVTDPAKGLSKSREVNGVRTTVRLLPAQLTALQELEGDPVDSCTKDWSAMLEVHRKMLCFKMGLAPDQQHFDGDVMYAGAGTYDEAIAHARDLNFGWEDAVELRCNGRTYRPVLSTLENTYGLSKDRTVLLAFVPGEPADTDFYSSSTIELIWRDDVLGTGVQRFRFLRSDLERAPSPKAAIHA